MNDLHKAAGGAEKDEPNRYARTDGFRNLIAAIRNEYESNPAKNGGKDWVTPCMTAGGRNGGTYVVKEMVYAYAMWVNADFHLKVIRVFEEYATKGMVMKPEVAQQAFDDPKVFMAKALMLAQGIDTITIRKDNEGRYCLNDLHKAAGGEAKHQPNFWLHLDGTEDLVDELIKQTPHFCGIKRVVGRNDGTYAWKEPAPCFGV